MRDKPAWEPGAKGRHNTTCELHRKNPESGMVWPTAQKGFFFFLASCLLGIPPLGPFFFLNSRGSHGWYPCMRDKPAGEPGA